MATLVTLSVGAHAASTPHGVYALLTDSASWPTWSPFSSVVIEDPGSDTKDGEGSVRRTRYQGTTGVERIVSLTPDRQVRYAYLSGSLSPFLRDYVGVVDLTEAEGGGTDIHWHATFTERFWGSGTVARFILQRFLQRCVDGLARSA